ncbi:MAG: hypothetical protein ACI936_004025 [Paraglaciecola sp.]|jgi:hypothetical protein
MPKPAVKNMVNEDGSDTDVVCSKEILSINRLRYFVHQMLQNLSPSMLNVQ